MFDLEGNKTRYHPLLYHHLELVEDAINQYPISSSPRAKHRADMSKLFDELCIKSLDLQHLVTVTTSYNQDAVLNIKEKYIIFQNRAFFHSKDDAMIFKLYA